jgi:hypothetical protein
MHSGHITFRDRDHVETVWDGYDKGKKTHSATFAVSRP